MEEIDSFLHCKPSKMIHWQVAWFAIFQCGGRLFPIGLGSDSGLATQLTPNPFVGSVHQSRQPPSGANEATWCDWSYDFVVLPFPFSPPPINTCDPTNMSHWTTLDWVWTNISPLQLFFFGNFQLITAFWVVTVRITAEEKKRRWDHFFLDIILIQISKVFPASLCDFVYNMKKEKAERVE